MYSVNHRRYQYLFLLPIVILVISAMYFSEVTKETQNSLLREKINEIVNAVDMLAQAMDANDASG